MMKLTDKNFKEVIVSMLKYIKESVYNEGKYRKSQQINRNYFYKSNENIRTEKQISEIKIQ